jgi:hypothetical protein
VRHERYICEVPVQSRGTWLAVRRQKEIGTIKPETARRYE